MRRSFNREFKEKVLDELATGRPVAEICKEYELNASVLHRWAREQEQNPKLAFAGHGNRAKMETRIQQLEQKVGQITMENDFINRVNKAMFEKIKEIKKNTRRKK